MSCGCSSSCNCSTVITLPTAAAGVDGLDGMFGGWSHRMVFSTAVSPSPPANNLRLNNATPASVTKLYVNDLNADGADIDAFLDAFDNSGDYGNVKIWKQYDSNTFWMGKVTAVTDNGADHTFTVTYIASNGTFASGESLVVSFAENGSDGKGWTAGAYDSSTGIATFASSDGLGFATGDLRGTNGTNGTDGVGVAGVGITTTTYDGLTALINTGSGTLIPGSLYRFPYQTKHLIDGSSPARYNYTTNTHDPGTGTKVSFTPVEEYIIVKALTTTKIATQVFSELHPRDIIYYDRSLNLTEDGTQPRPGFITYREDPDTDVSTHFDFRNVLHRRYDVLTTLNRDAEAKVALNYIAGSAVNHSFSLIGEVTTYGNYNVSGNFDLGIIPTALKGTAGDTFSDFKTFVGYGDNLYDNGSSGEKPRFLNVHIKKSNKVGRITGSGTGTIETVAGIVGGFYPSFANVVIFSRVAEDISIGSNASGITIMGRSSTQINIGHNNENILIGGTNLPTLVGGLVRLLGHNSDISIRNNNRNIAIVNNSKRISIGSRNLGIYLSSGCRHVEIGSYNNKIYGRENSFINIDDFNLSVLVSFSHGVHIKSSNKNIEIISSGSASFSAAGPFGVTIPGGFGASESAADLANPSIKIGYLCEDIFLVSSNGVTLLSTIKSVFLKQCTSFEISNNSGGIRAANCTGIVIGENSQHIEIGTSDKIVLGSNQNNVKVNISQYVTIGDNATSSIFEACQDVKVSDLCSNSLFYASSNLTVGNNCSNTVFRNCYKGVVGENPTNVYIEFATNFTIGLSAFDVIINDTNILLKFNPASFQAYNISLALRDFPRAQFIPGTTTYSYTNAPSGPLDLDLWRNSAATLVGITFSSNTNNVGNNCNNVVLVRCTGNDIKDSCEDIYIGTDSTTEYIIPIVSGVLSPSTAVNVVSTTVTGTASTVTGFTYTAAVAANATITVNSAVAADTVTNITISGGTIGGFSTPASGTSDGVDSLANAIKSAINNTITYPNYSASRVAGVLTIKPVSIADYAAANSLPAAVITSTGSPSFTISTFSGGINSSLAQFLSSKIPVFAEKTGSNFNEINGHCTGVLLYGNNKSYNSIASGSAGLVVDVSNIFENNKLLTKIHTVTTTTAGYINRVFDITDGAHLYGRTMLRTVGQVIATADALVPSITTNTSDATNAVNTTVTLVGGTGTGAVATVTVTSNAVTAITVTASGSNYVIGDTLTIPTSVIGGSTAVIVTLVANDLFEASVLEAHSKLV